MTMLSYRKCSQTSVEVLPSSDTKGSQKCNESLLSLTQHSGPVFNLPAHTAHLRNPVVLVEDEGTISAGQ